MHWYTARMICPLAMLVVNGSVIQANDQTSYTTAVGVSGTDSFVFGTELWVVSELNLLPSHNLRIETAEVRYSPERLLRLRDGRFDFALVDDEVPTSFARDLRAVMALWPGGVDKVGAQATQLLVRAEIPDDVVYHVTRTIFEHAAQLRSAHATMGIGSPRSAVVGLALPMHPGALRYYEERGLGFGGHVTSMAGKPEIAQGDEPEGTVGLTFSETNQLTAACRNAAAQGVLRSHDRDDLADACDVDDLDLVDADLANSSPGRGGPKVITRRGGATDWGAAMRRDYRQTQTPGLEPTM